MESGPEDCLFLFEQSTSFERKFLSVVVYISNIKSAFCLQSKHIHSTTTGILTILCLPSTRSGSRVQLIKANFILIEYRKDRKL